MEKYTAKYKLREIGEEEPMTGPGEENKGLENAYERAKLSLFKYAKTKMNTARATEAVNDCLRILDSMTISKYSSGVQSSFMRFVDKFFSRFQ